MKLTDVPMDRPYEGEHFLAQLTEAIKRELADPEAWVYGVTKGLAVSRPYTHIEVWSRGQHDSFEVPRIRGADVAEWSDRVVELARDMVERLKPPVLRDGPDELAAWLVKWVEA